MAATEHVRIGKRGEMTLPKSVRNAYLSAYGIDLTEMDVSLREDGVVEMRPALRVDATQAFFWNPEWLAAERKANKDIESGRVTTHATGDDFLASLDDDE